MYLVHLCTLCYLCQKQCNRCSHVVKIVFILLAFLNSQAVSLNFRLYDYDVVIIKYFDFLKILRTNNHILIRFRIILNCKPILLRSKNIKNNIRKNCKNKNNNKRQYHSNLDECMKYCIRFHFSFEMINLRYYSKDKFKIVSTL